VEFDHAFDLDLVQARTPDRDIDLIHGHSFAPETDLRFFPDCDNNLDFEFSYPILKTVTFI